MTKNKKHIKTILIGAVILSSAALWSGGKLYGQYYISTDDAYLNANVVQIAPRISGQVNQTFVDDNQHVSANQPLFEVDPIPYELAIKKEQAQLNIKIASLQNAEAKALRTMQLVKKKFASPQDKDNVTAALNAAKAAVRLAKTTLEQAKLNLAWSKISAPTSGWVTNLHLRQGDLVGANQPVFSLVSDKGFWVDANFKETQLASIKPGQLATIKVDMYPDKIFHGVVESISAGTGAVFSLLPPQNATANWVKVTQRVPVKIRVIKPNPHYPLRVGTSASVTISLQKYYQPSLVS